MTSNKQFHIQVFGLSTYEQRVLQTISILSRNRARTYLPKNEGKSDTADFAIVDGDNPEALTSWQAFEVRNPMVQAIMVGKSPASEAGDFQIARPIMATRLLALLDRMQISKERPAFMPPKARHNASAGLTPTHPTGEPLPADNRILTRGLVVDDSLPIRKQMEFELQSFVGEVDLAENGEQAIELLSTKNYDIVFLDVVLPGMDGYQICRTAKRLKNTKDTPIIMLTGKSSPFDRVRGKLAGCDTYLTKPVNLAKFGKVVKTFLKPAEQEQMLGSYLTGRTAPALALP